MARIDGRLVGAAGHSLYRLALDGDERLCQLSVHAVTAPDARGLGIFGSPTFAVDGELFWGDDRLDDAIAWRQRGRLD